MKTKATTSIILMVTAPVSTDVAVSNGPISYLIGGIIALLIMGYMVYSLLKPENF